MPRKKKDKKENEALPEVQPYTNEEETVLRISAYEPYDNNDDVVVAPYNFDEAQQTVTDALDFTSVPAGYSQYGEENYSESINTTCQDNIDLRFESFVDPSDNFMHTDMSNSEISSEYITQNEGYLRDSQETDGLEFEVQPNVGYFKSAYGSQNDEVLEGNFFISHHTATPLKPMTRAPICDEEPENVIETVSSRQTDHVTKTHNDTSLMRPHWQKCGCPTNWNERFQELLDLDDSTEEKCLEKYQKLSALSADFVHTAKNFGKVIISERSFKNDHRTLCPRIVGGVAGGEKYIHHGILFKFALNWQNIFPSDEAAMKAAGHELKGVMRYAQCDGLHVPLMAIIEYRGYRVVAESILPINSGTLCYGSSDGGRNVHDSDEELNKLMKKAGQKLNIKPHYSGLDGSCRKFLYGPTDIEGHKGEDKRYYVIDFARVFPPTAERNSKISATYLYKLFRPEFIKEYSKPLSSDAFSKFASEDLAVLFPRPPRSSTPGSLENFVEIRDITELIHRAGINVRYLGLIRTHVPDYLKPTILHEMCSRAIKNRLRSTLRNISKKIVHPQEDTFRQGAIEFLNLVLGHDQKISAHQYWCTQIKEDIINSFGTAALTEEEQSPDFDLRDNIVIFRLFKRVQSLSGVVLTKQAQQDLKEHPESFQIVQPDINKVAVKVKHMNIISLAEAKALAIASMKQNRSSERLFRLACSKFDIAIQATPGNLETLNAYADFLVKYATRNPNRTDNIILFKRALEKYKTTKNYKKIFALAENLTKSSYFDGDREGVVVNCYETICGGEAKTDRLCSASLLGLSRILVSQARRLNRPDLYDKAGKRFREALTNSILQKDFKLIRDVSKQVKWGDTDLAVIFEIHEQSPQLQCINSTWCYKTRDSPKLTAELLCTLVDKFKVKELRLPQCDHLTYLNIIDIIQKPKYSFTVIDISKNTQINDPCISKIAELCSNSLTELNISGCTKITANGLEHLEQCDKLQKLYISHCNSTKNFINSIGFFFRSIQVFHMQDCVDASIQAVHDLEYLEEFNLSGVPVQSIAQLSSFPKLRIINLSRCSIKSLAPLESLQYIEELNLHTNPVLDGNSLVNVCLSSPNLKKLDIRKCKLITDSQIDEITTHCQGLTHLYISKTAQISPCSAASIFRNLHNLEELYIKHIHLEAALEEGFDFPNMRSLSLIDAGLKSSVSKLARCEKLEELDLSNNKDLTEDSFNEIILRCNIKRLNISNCLRLSDTVIDTIGKNLRCLEVLNISHVQLFCNLNPLGNCRMLVRLIAEECGQLRDMNDILNRCYLTELNVRGCSMLLKEFLDNVLKCKSLRTFTLGNNKISNTNVDEFLCSAARILPRTIIQAPTPKLKRGSTGGLEYRVRHPNLRESMP